MARISEEFSSGSLASDIFLYRDELCHVVKFSKILYTSITYLKKIYSNQEIKEQFSGDILSLMEKYNIKYNPGFVNIWIENYISFCNINGIIVLNESIRGKNRMLSKYVSPGVSFRFQYCFNRYVFHRASPESRFRNDGSYTKKEKVNKPTKREHRFKARDNSSHGMYHKWRYYDRDRANLLYLKHKNKRFTEQ